jgi:hypothetical protein
VPRMSDVTTLRRRKLHDEGTSINTVRVIIHVLKEDVIIMTSITL